jgi:hypothetical protein
MDETVMCQLCGEHMDDPDLTTGHRECMLREVLGGIGHHIAHEYWCKQRHDPDAGFTYRESAQMVYAIFHVNPGLLLDDPRLPVRTADERRPH